MKRFAFLTFALLLVQAGQGRSVEPGNLLTISVQPLHVQRQAEVVTVKFDSFGGVVAKTCAIFEEDCDTEFLGHLDRGEFYALNQNIKQARKESLTFPAPGGIVCLAVPNKFTTIHADNASLLIKSGSEPCGGDMIRRQGEATEKLIQLAGKYYAKAID